jgi:hypothetical protein
MENGIRAIIDKTCPGCGQPMHQGSTPMNRDGTRKTYYYYCRQGCLKPSGKPLSKKIPGPDLRNHKTDA